MEIGQEEKCVPIPTEQLQIRTEKRMEKYSLDSVAVVRGHEKVVDDDYDDDCD